jgi:ATP-dependent Clp protease ATP-binding subunit ClpA
MFERYNEQARRSIFVARYEASQSGSPSINPEHLLLGILREDRRLPDGFLQDGDTSAAIRARIEAALPRGPKVSTSVDLPLSRECKRAVAYAAEEAERLQHHSITPGHLTVGLLREGTSLAAQVLRENGFTMEAMREFAVSRPAAGPAPGPMRAVARTGRAWSTAPPFAGRFAPEVFRFYQLASAVAGKMGSACIETKHLLLALLERGGGIFGAGAAAMREQIKREPPRRETISAHALAPTNECMRVFSYALEEAGLLGSKEVGAGHLALGLLREESCEAAEILRANGFSLEKLHQAVASAPPPDPQGRNYV